MLDFPCSGSITDFRGLFSKNFEAKILYMKITETELLLVKGFTTRFGKK